MRRVDAARTVWINDDRLLRRHGKSKHPRGDRRNSGGRRLSVYLENRQQSPQVTNGSDSVIRRCLLNVRMTPEIGRRADIDGCLKSANSGSRGVRNPGLTPSEVSIPSPKFVIMPGSHGDNRT